MIGETLALGAAGCWAFAVVLFKRVVGVPPLAINLFKNVLSTLLLLVTMGLFGVSFDLERPAHEWRDLVLSGVLGIAIADTLYLDALRRVGASTVAVIECAYAPTIVLMAVVFLGDPLTGGFALGALAVVGGLLVAVWPGKTRASGVGLALGFGAMFFMAVGVTIAKAPLDRGHLIEVTTVRLIAGIAGQVVWIVLTAQREMFAVLRPGPAWRRLVPAGLVGTYLAMLLWLGGLKYTHISVASVLNQLSVAFTLFLAWAWLREPIGARKLAGAALSLGGALVVVLSR